jgi:hypothetical protein
MMILEEAIAAACVDFQGKIQLAVLLGLRQGRLVRMLDGRYLAVVQ